MSDSGDPAASSGLSSDIATLAQLVSDQLKAADAREKQLTDILQQALSQLSSPSVPSASTSTSPAPKTVSVERPMLMSSATLADFTAWEEMWRDYSQCQHLSSQDKCTRMAAVRQCLDEDLRRFLREGIIVLPPQPDSPDLIAAVKEFTRQQRNPLLDRISFYARRQERG